MHVSRIIAHIALATAITATTVSPTDAAWGWTVKSTDEVKADKRDLVASRGLRGLIGQASPNEVSPANVPVSGIPLLGDKQPSGYPMLPADSPSTGSSLLNDDLLQENPVPPANGLVHGVPLLSSNQPLQTPMLSGNGPITGYRFFSGNESPMLPANSPITGLPLLSGNIPSTFEGEQISNGDEYQQNVDEDKGQNFGHSVSGPPTTTLTGPHTKSGIPPFENLVAPAKGSMPNTRRNGYQFFE
uniref:Secreted RxLR effector protein 28 n=1 Tax=Plasmopara viticola TaxID=143451 RepID=RLR28_PLAVT|nr:RecName: Full=Secreted RxLR effector protein 28; Flags: Precursor [Plasmopara viticola]ANC73378.1 secreted RxLR effector peptide protein 28 [Plasmopara viticola]